MNSWSHENYNMEMSQMLSPLVPPICMMPQNMNIPPMNPPPNAPLALIGPVAPDDMHVETDELTNDRNSQVQDSQTNQTEDVSSTQNQKRKSRDRSNHSSRRDRNASDHGRRRSRSRDRHDRYSRSDRSGRNRHDRHRNEDRDKKTKWDSTEAAVAAQQGALLANNMPNVNMGMMPVMNMMHYQNMISNQMMTGQQTMDGTQMQMIPNMNMMTSMMPNMMDQNMMMMNHQMIPSMMNNQQIFISNAVLLPPIPGVSLPERRERPKGCRTVFVGGLPQNVKHDMLNEMFQRFGAIQNIRSPKSGVYYVRFEREESVENSFSLSGYRFKYHDQTENEATTIFVDYALNRDDQNEYEKRKREPTPPIVEPFTPNALSNITEKIKSETEFSTAAHTLAFWLERGECNKKYANTFYSLIQASNNQIRRLFNEKMQLDEEFQSMKNSIKDKFAHVVMQFEQVAKILSAAKHQRVSDHFTKQQRRNIEMWLKMTEEVENIKEEFNALFEDEEIERSGKNVVPLEKYEELKKENENLTYELEGYKNEAYLAKDEAERKFEKFKAHFIAQQALQQPNKQVYPPLPSQLKFDKEPLLPTPAKPMPPPPTPDDDKIIITGPSVPPSEAKIISILTAFLMVHPLGASLDYLVSYVRSMTPNVTQATILATLQKYTDVFHCKTTGVGACIEHRWSFITFDTIRQEM